MLKKPTRQAIFLGSLCLLLVFLPPIAQAIDEPYLVSLFSRILIYALAAASLDLILGYGGMVSLGHAAFFGIGAYVAAIFAYHNFDGTPILSWPVVIQGHDSALVAWPAAIIVSALLAAVIGALSLRTTGMHFIMITLAFAQMLYYFFVSLEIYGGDDGLSLFARHSLPGLDLSRDTHFYYLCLGILLVFLVLASRLVVSRFGMVVRGSRDNDRRMQALGFPTFRYKLVCFIIAGATAGLAGALIANQTEYVSPGLMHWTRSGIILVMVLLGGSGTLFGPVLGAAAFLLLEEILSMYTEHWMVYLGPFLILVVLYARHGLYGIIAGREQDHA
ncbi:MAG: branched-chain amino acid ABC transporter permease [Desulfuromonadales bacterium]|jgi:branched-chain amino acid transport system permease protein